MTWTPNDNQKKFLEVLTDEPCTLAELSQLAGITFKTGTINSLVKKGLVAHGDNKEIVCPCCGHKTKVRTWKRGDKKLN